MAGRSLGGRGRQNVASAAAAGGARCRAGRPGRRRGARARGAVDLTGYWVAVVNEDWRYRMVMPAKGDYRGVPITRRRSRS